MRGVDSAAKCVDFGRGEREAGKRGENTCSENGATKSKKMEIVTTQTSENIRLMECCIELHTYIHVSQLFLLQNRHFFHSISISVLLIGKFMDTSLYIHARTIKSCRLSKIRTFALRRRKKRLARKKIIIA